MTTMLHDTSSPESGMFAEFGELIEGKLWINLQNGSLYAQEPAIELTFPMLAVRHGQTDSNIANIWQGQIDGPTNQLNAVGKEQARLAAINLYDHFQGLFGDHLLRIALAGRLVILSSPLGRAKDTANAFREYFSRQTEILLPLRIEPDLAEIFFGDVEGQSLETLNDELRRCLLEFKKGREAAIDWNGTGESFSDVVLRGARLLERLEGQYGGTETIVVAFSHGTCINALRVALGDALLIEPDGRVAFRKHLTDNGEPYWLGESYEYALRLAKRVAQQSPLLASPN